MKLLLFGRHGQVGWELQRSLAPLGDVVAPDRQGETGLCGDLADLPGIVETVRKVRPDVIVNAAAYTAVDRAESDPEMARRINAEAPASLAEAAKVAGAWLVHYSTDYVFDGSGSRAWCETDPTAPLNIYGETKLAGEQAIRDSGCRHLLFRTSWVYSVRGDNFARTMLRLASERERLNVINDQFGAPTGAELLADVTAHAIRAASANPALSGFYHLAASGETTWHGYACHVIESARKAGFAIRTAPDAIVPVATSAFPTPARRPANSRLDCRKLQDAFGLYLPHWKIGVVRMITELQGNPA